MARRNADDMSHDESWDLCLGILVAQDKRDGGMQKLAERVTRVLREKEEDYQEFKRIICGLETENMQDLDFNAAEHGHQWCLFGFKRLGTFYTMCYDGVANTEEYWWEYDQNTCTFVRNDFDGPVLRSEQVMWHQLPVRLRRQVEQMFDSEVPQPDAWTKGHPRLNT